MGAFNNRIARDIEFAIVCATNSKDMENNMQNWFEEHRNDKIIDIQMTETDDQYSAHIFYEEGY